MKHLEPKVGMIGTICCHLDASILDAEDVEQIKTDRAEGKRMTYHFWPTFEEAYEALVNKADPTERDEAEEALAALKVKMPMTSL